MDALIFCIPLNEKRSKAKENFLFKGCNKNTKGSINDIWIILQPWETLDDLPTKEYYYSKNQKKLCGKNKPRKQNYIIYFPSNKQT